MKLLIVSQHFWPETFRINDVARSLRDAGCDVTVLTGQPNYPEGAIYPGYRAAEVRREHYDGIDMVRVPLVPRGSAGSVRLALNYLSFIASASILGSWALRKARFDAILVYGTSPILQAIPAILLKHLHGAALVTWVQDLWPESLVVTGHVRRPGLLAMVDSVVRWIYRRNDLLLGQSEAFVPVIQAKASGVPVHFHPNPGDMLTDGGEEHDFGPGFHLVFAGNLGKAQALPTILEAAEMLRDADDIQIHLVGGGSETGWLRQTIAARGLGNVHLPGRFPPEAMPGIFAAASALLLTLGRSDILEQTVPSKLQAYLQAGKPIVASIDGAAADVVRRAGAGHAVPAEDAAALAGAIRSLARTDEASRAAMGASARAYFAQHYDPAMLAERLMALLLAARSGRGTGRTG